MIKEYWDDVDPGNRPRIDREDEAAVMVERPTLAEIFPEDLTRMTVLTVGCDDHEPPKELARRGAKVVVVDPDEEALDEMFQSMAAEGLDTDLVVHDPLHMESIPDDGVGLVTTGATVNETPQLDRLYREFFRVLAPGGALMVITPHPLVSGGHGITSDNGKNQWLVDDYFAPVKVSRQWTIEEHVSALNVCGFYLERLLEPKPDPRTRTINTTSWNLFNKIPQLLVFVARKPRQV
ncbi:MAG: class I SAM-dependent methyltransferase [Thermoplasmata archaeon]|nr:MAG: class I SAM-dependent methyltransferase [Thermoplasmata archaeon]